MTWYFPRIWETALLAFIFVGVGMARELSCPQECECFIDYSTFYNVDCSERDLLEIPPGIDDQVQILDLSNNLITSIQPGVLSSFVYLEKLNLSNNQISSLSSYSLMNLTSLDTLDLSRNLIKQWKDINPNFILRPATNLRRLILSKNPLRGFANLQSTELFSSESLHVLELKDCGFTSIIGKSPIAGLASLVHLSLSHNPLKRVHKLTSSSLKSLDLSHCELSYFASDELSFLPSLTHLRLSHNIRLSINDAEAPSKRLSSSSVINIDLSYCNMNHVSLAGFPLLQVANLRGNMLRRLNAGEFINNTYLRTLDFSSNSLELVDKNAFNGLESLKTLNLSINVIPYLHDYTFMKLRNLTELYLSRNYFSSLGFIKSNSIKILDMSYCEIQNVDKISLKDMTALEEINLSKNLLSSIPDFFSSKSLKVLDLSFNRLSKINNNTFASLPSLETLRISSNRFSDTWSSSYFDSNSNLESLEIRDNIWRCDCHDSEMEAFYEYLTKYPPLVWNVNDLICSSPTNYSGKTWWEACYFAWKPGGFLTSNQRALTYLLIIFIIFFVVGFAIMLIRRAQHAKNLALREQTEREEQILRDRLREDRMRREQEQQRNAPDPRDLVSPPSYDEALLMPRLDGSYHSLAGVGVSQDKKRRKKLDRRTRSSNDLLEMDPELGNTHRMKNRRRRRSTVSANGVSQRDEESNEVQRQTNASPVAQVITVQCIHESDF